MTRRSIDPVAVGLALGWLADRAVGDPRRGHPVAAFGRWATWVESRAHADSRAAGVLTEAVVLSPVVALGLAAGRLPAPALTVAITACTWAALGGTSLGREGLAVHDLLAAEDLPAARVCLVWKEGRKLSPCAGQFIRMVKEAGGDWGPGLSTPVL